MAAQNVPIIIVKKKVNGHAHHGGAWKVAYADFVTAMMALFIVLWLLNTSPKVKNSVAGYFKDPRGLAKETGTKDAGTGDALHLKKDDMPKLKEKLIEAMKKVEDFAKIHQQVQLMITPEGLRVELMETKGGCFFKNGSAAATEDGKALLTALAGEISKLPNHVLIEGHTNSVPYTSTAGYTNWELSTDRANSARRVMQQAGLLQDHISYVRGFADRRLKNEADPLDPSNRRVSLVIQYQEAEQPKAEPVGAKTAGNVTPAVKAQAAPPAKAK